MRETIRNSYFRGCWICLTLGLVFLAIGLSLVAFLSQNEVLGKSQEGYVAVAFLTFAMAFCLLLGSFLAGLMARRVSRLIGLIRSRNYLVHWSYRPDEWDAFQVAESPLLRRDFRKIVVVPFLIGLPIGLIFLTIKIFSEEKPDVGGLVIAGIGTCIFVAIVFIAAYYFRVVRRRAWARNQRTFPPDSYLHPEFVHANGEFLFGVFNQQLSEVQVLLGEPARIEFTIRGYAPRGGEMLEVYRVLVPAGQRNRAIEVVAAIRAVWGLGQLPAVPSTVQTPLAQLDSDS